MKIVTHACAQGAVLPLCGNQASYVSRLSGHALSVCDLSALPSLPVGTMLVDATKAPAADENISAEKALFTVVGRLLWPTAERAETTTPHAQYLPVLKAHTALSEGEVLTLRAQRQGHALAWITLSDKGSQGLREDKSGPLIAQMLRPALALNHEQGFLLPDDAPALQALILELALGQGYDIICTTGGTGIGPRDVTPQAMEKLLDTRLYGFEQMMMQASLQKTPHAALSRAMVGLIGTCLCINLPGSVKAVRENIEAILPALPHALDKIHVHGVDCGSE